LLDAAVERAREFPGPHAEAIGIGALKYFELSTNRVRDYAFDHCMSVYAEISQELTDLADKHAGGIRKFTLLQGLEAGAVV